MKKRGRLDRFVKPRPSWLVVVFLQLGIILQWQHNVSAAVFPIGKQRQNSWGYRGAISTKSTRIRKDTWKISIRGGAVNWDEPYYSDSSDAEESNFLPSPPPSEESVPFEEESDEDDEGQSEGDNVLDSPFLNSFQREIHSIVSDYRQEVTETFQDLMDDVLYARDTQQDGRLPPRRRSNRYPPRNKNGEDEDDEEGESETENDRYPTRKNARRYVSSDVKSEPEEDTYPRKRAPARRTFEEEEENSSESESENDSGFVVGDSDEEGREVLSKLRDEPRSSSVDELWEKVGWEDEQQPVRATTKGLWQEEDGQTYYSSRGKQESSTESGGSSIMENNDKLKEEHANEKLIKNPKKKRRKRRTDEQHEVDNNRGRIEADYDDDEKAAIARGASSNVVNSQMWKSVTVAISFLAIAILLNIVIQVLSKVLSRASI